MPDLAIRVENLSKLYPSTALRTGRIGATQAPYKILRETLTDAATAPFRYLLDGRRRTADGGCGSTTWALKGVSFRSLSKDQAGVNEMNWSDLSVLITGGTGSFGKKLTEIMLRKYRPRKLIIFSRDELKQHEMRQVYPDTGDSPMRYFIGDIRDKERLHRALSGVDVVVHAAALKQVPACEYNPFEAVKTNVLGAQNVIEAALDAGVQKVMAISTDKAVNPINLYGATKLCAEKMFVQSNSYSGEKGARFSCCRYGNVVGSRGSVVPVFLEQRKNGTITLTDPRMTRFWITLEQGVEFVIKCIGLMQGGEIFVPKIPSMKTIDLAKLIAPEAEIEIIGVRPGEKIHEVLVSEDEARHTLELDDMFVIQPVHHWWRAEDWAHAKPLPDGFRYTSDTNTRWLTPDEMQSLIG